MTTTLIDGIGELVTNDSSVGRGALGIVEDAAVVVEAGVVAWVGPRGRAPATDDRHDVAGRAVLPGFVDAHTHLVFAGDRVEEFAARMAGRPYAAGGIHSTVMATREATDDVLRRNVRRLVDEATSSGTTTLEIKSGYGLTVADEVRSLRVAREFADVTTFLGAHVVPPEFDADPDGYVDLVRGEMLDACADLATSIDVFCDRGAFDVDQARVILEAGRERGLVPRLHANQLGPGPGVQLGVEVGAASVDHCTYLDDTDIDALASSDTVALLLPAAEFSTRSPYPDARRLIDAGATVALATDCNPGTSYTSDMPFTISLAVREMRMTPSEAVWAATAGGARALGRADVGTLRPGSRADLIVLREPSHLHLAYRPGTRLVDQVWRRGRPIATGGLQDPVVQPSTQ